MVYSLHIAYFCRVTAELPYPKVSLSPSSLTNLNLGTKGMNSPNSCSVVVVGGSALHDLQAVLDLVDTLGDDMQKLPYAIFLQVDTASELNMTRHAMSPPVVSH